MLEDVGAGVGEVFSVSMEVGSVVVLGLTDAGAGLGMAGAGLGLAGIGCPVVDDVDASDEGLHGVYSSSTSSRAMVPCVAEPLKVEVKMSCGQVRQQRALLYHVCSRLVPHAQAPSALHAP